MERLRGLYRYFSLFLVCLLLVVGCRATTPDTPKTRGGDRISIGTTLKPRTIDPADSYELAGLFIIYNVGETLYTYEPGTTTLKPLLAKDFPKISPDGLTYRIPLRQGVIFHDGTPFNAEAMVFSLNRFLKNGGEPSFLLGDTIDTVKAIGEYEIEIALKRPFAAFPALLAYPGACAVSPKAYEIGEGKFKNEELIGTGPYRLTEVTSDAFRLDAFDRYWGEPAKNKGVDVQIYLSNPANLFNAFQTGAIDVAYQSLLAPQVRKLREEAENGKWKAIESSGSAINFMALNFNSEPTNNISVRRAIASLIDRDLLNDRILQGQGIPLFSLIPTTFAESRPVFEKRYGRRDVEGAKQYLKTAGYSAEKPATVEIWHSSGSITSSTVAAVLKALSKRDLEGMIRFEPNSILGAAFFKNIGRGLYTTALSNWYPDFLDADNYIYPFLDCAKGSPKTGCEEGGARGQGSFFYSQKMNELIDRSRTESDPAKRTAIFAEIQDILAEEVPYIPLWQTKEYAFARNGLRGVIINPSQTFPFWTIEGKSTS
ncbi:ABC transporter substrate-binding protein [Pannus brasiliensis CCIBt3594]|uniref:ABC transporter substrate-binding protein n=1 Tax=Pannus brasiliensis CCIBt3594 TaxID=1427578 RepID=A0AAW9QI38_9CHRO